MTTRQAIDEMVSRIVRRFDPEKVILFGSQARGDAGPDSDVDLLIVVESFKGSRRVDSVDIWCDLADVPVASDVFLITSRELELHKNIPGTLGRAAQRDGKILYERVH